MGYERCKMLPLGTPVYLRLDDGTEIATVTRSGVWETGSGTFLIQVEGRSGGWDCSRVRVAS
jgi:hypothetical protein